MIELYLISSITVGHQLQTVQQQQNVCPQQTDPQTAQHPFFSTREVPDQQQSNLNMSG